MFTIRKINEWWYVESPDDTRFGPYLPNMAIEIAAAHVLLARKRGLDTSLLVRDEYGHDHNCSLMDKTDDPNRCQECISAWPNAGISVSCPLHAA